MTNHEMMMDERVVSEENPGKPFPQNMMTSSYRDHS